MVDATTAYLRKGLLPADIPRLDDQPAETEYLRRFIPAQTINYSVAVHLVVHLVCGCSVVHGPCCRSRS